MSGRRAVSIRVWVLPIWDAVRLDVTPNWSVARLKVEALAEATGKTVDPSDYVVKHRGAAMLDEIKTLDALDVVNGAPFVVLPRRRQPVR